MHMRAGAAGRRLALPLLLAVACLQVHVQAATAQAGEEDGSLRDYLKTHARKLWRSSSTEMRDSMQRRLGRLKKRTQDGIVFASYGLSPHAVEPSKVVPYSDSAVRAASSRRGALAAAPRRQPKVDLRPYMSAVEDQKSTNSCAANALAGAYEYLATRAALREGRDDGGDVSRLFIYYVGRKFDQRAWGEDTSLQPKDEGMTLGGAIGAVQTRGAALQASWEFDLARVNARPPDAAFAEAIRFKVGDAMKVPLDLERMRRCLADGYPIVFGLKLTEAFFRPPHDGYIPTPDPSDPASADHGLHAMLIVGYNDRQRVFIVRNSWGEGWGVAGYCYLSYDYVCNAAFNFLGMYAVQSLTDDDLTPDDDDGADHDFDAGRRHAAPDGAASLEEVLEDAEEEDVADDGFDVEEVFGSRAEARRAFLHFAGDLSEMSADNLQLSKEELHQALLLMGIPMVTNEEVDLAFKRYDDDDSGYINFEEFLDMQELFDGSLLRRQRRFAQLRETLGEWETKAKSWWRESVLDGILHVADHEEL